MADPRFLRDQTPELLKDVKPVTLDDVAHLDDPEIKDLAEYYLPSDILAIDDGKVSSDSRIGHIVLRWLNPDHRARVGLNGWQWVSGELAAYIREKGYVEQTVGGGSGTTVITNGDLVLAFMSRRMYDAMKLYKREKARKEMDGVLEQATARSELSRAAPEGREEPDVISDISLRRTYEGNTL